MSQHLPSNFTRAFEISAEYRSLAHSNKNAFSRWLKSWALTLEYYFLPFYFGEPPTWRLRLRKWKSSNRMVPNYIMTGPIKSGSSDFSMHLLFHPHVLSPLSKEFPITSSGDWRAYYPTIRNRKALEKEINGMVRSGYLYPDLNNIRLAEKLYDINPNAKVIITLRDPVKRAYSHWKWELFLGGIMVKEMPYMEQYSSYIERALDFHPSIRLESFCGFPLLNTGIYHKAVERWINTFGNENVLVLDVAEYFTDRHAASEKVQAFLEIPVVEIPELSVKMNENPLTFPPPDKETENALAAFYKSYNEKLFEVIGKRFDWI